MPYKVTEQIEGHVVVEDIKKRSFNVKTIINIEIGDYVFIDNYIITEKAEKESVEEFIQMIKQGKES